MIQIYLIRHGATGIRERYQNPEDKLNPDGKKMVLALARKLKTLGIAKIYTSPFKRAQESAKLIGKQLQLEPQIKEELEEIGLIRNPADFSNPNLIEAVQKSRATRQEAWRKIEPFLQGTIKEFSGQTVVWVCHGNLIRAILAGVFEFSSKSITHFQVDLTSVTIMEWDEKDKYFRLKLFNDTDHLRNMDHIL